MTDLRMADFVRVSLGSDERPGHDGMVWAPPDADGNVGLTFYYDRYGDAVRDARGRLVPCEGIECWNLSELDLSTVDR